MSKRKIYITYISSIIVMFLMVIAIVVVANIFIIKFINDYNDDVKKYGLLTEFDYTGQYNHLFISDKIYAENPVVFNNKEYLSVIYQKHMYCRHTRDDYEKRWNGRYWYEVKVQKEYNSWDLVKDETTDVDRIYFNILVFDKNILSRMEFETISENIGNGVKEYYYGVENNQDIILYIENYNSLRFDEIIVYDSYEEALKDQCIPFIFYVTLFNAILIIASVIFLYVSLTKLNLEKEEWFDELEKIEIQEEKSEE